MRREFGSRGLDVNDTIRPRPTLYDIYEVAQLLGHQSPATTTVYARWDQEAAAATVAAMPAPC